MLALPEQFELISFFEAEPQLAAKDTPWEYNSITFVTARGENQIRCHIEPDVGELQFSWSQKGFERVNFTLNNIASISVHIGKNDECLIASGGDTDPKQLVKIRLKPEIAIEWSSKYAF